MGAEKSPDAKAGEDSGSGGIPLVDELGERLDDADALQARADALTGDIAELELAGIEAGMDTTTAPAGMSPDDLAAVGELLVRRAELNDAVLGFAKPVRPPETRQAELARIVDAIDALHLWLHPPKADQSKAPAHGARIVLLIVVVLCCWGAWVWHPILLALIIPVAAPIGLLLNRGDDKMWRRMGAKQNFERTGVDAPADWETGAVEARHTALVEYRGQLEARIEAETAAEEERDEATLDRDFGELQIELVEVEQQLAARSRRHALNLDEDDADHGVFRDAARVAGERRRLKELRRERSRLAGEAGAIRDGVWRSLRDQGVVTEGGAADHASLQAALKQLRADSGTTVH